MRIYGLTGGIGSGKSEVARRFEYHGVPVIDADNVAHEILEPNGPAFAPVIDTFGKHILTEGRIDRAKLGALVFADPEARAKLNAITHPHIRMGIAQRCADLAEKGHSYAVIEAALFGERGRKDDFLTGLIVVNCPQDIRVQRLVSQRGITEEDASSRVAAQMPPEAKFAFADYVIDNDGTIAALHGRVDDLVTELAKHGE